MGFNYIGDETLVFGKNVFFDVDAPENPELLRLFKVFRLFK